MKPHVRRRLFIARMRREIDQLRAKIAAAGEPKTIRERQIQTLRLHCISARERMIVNVQAGRGALIDAPDMADQHRADAYDAAGEVSERDYEGDK